MKKIINLSLFVCCLMIFSPLRAEWEKVSEETYDEIKKNPPKPGIAGLKKWMEYKSELGADLGRKAVNSLQKSIADKKKYKNYIADLSQAQKESEKKESEKKAADKAAAEKTPKQMGKDEKLAASRKKAEEASAKKAPLTFGAAWLYDQKKTGTMEKLVLNSSKPSEVSDEDYDGMPQDKQDEYMKLHNGYLKWMDAFNALKRCLSPIEVKDGYKMFLVVRIKDPMKNRIKNIIKELQGKKVYPAPMDAFNRAWSEIYSDQGLNIIDSENIPSLKAELIEYHVGMDFGNIDASESQESDSATNDLNIDPNWIKEAIAYFTTKKNGNVQPHYIPGCLKAVGTPEGYSEGSNCLTLDSDRKVIVTFPQLVGAIQDQMSSPSEDSKGSGGGGAPQPTEKEVYDAIAGKLKELTKEGKSDEVKEEVMRALAQDKKILMAKIDPMIESLMKGDDYAAFEKSIQWPNDDFVAKLAEQGIEAYQGADKLPAVGDFWEGKMVTGENLANLPKVWSHGDLLAALEQEDHNNESYKKTIEVGKVWKSRFVTQELYDHLGQNLVTPDVQSRKKLINLCETLSLVA